MKLIDKLGFDRAPHEFELLETERGEPYPYGKPRRAPQEIREEKDVLLTKDLEQNLDYFKRCFRSDINSDFILRPFKLGGKISACVLAINGMASSNVINEFILRDGTQTRKQFEGGDLLRFVLEEVLCVDEAKEAKSCKAIKAAVLSGCAAVLFEGEDRAIIFEARGFEKRGVGNPQNENVVIGPKEAFSESIRTNVTLLRRIVQREDLICEFRDCGAQNNINVGILYLESLANPTLIQEVKRRLSRIRTRSILSIGTLEQLSDRHPLFPVPQVLNTERPDRAANFLMQGHVILLLDGSPFAMVMPITLFSLLSTSEDSYMRPTAGSIVRTVRYLGILLSLLLPGVFLSLALHHEQLLSDQVLSTLYRARESVTLSLGMEVFILLIIFQLVREAGLRAPGPVGQSIGIIGGLVMGQAAVSANLVSTVSLIVVALVGLGNFAVPDYSTQLSIVYLRGALTVAGWVAGLAGVSLGFLMIMAALASMKSYGVPFLTPFFPRTYSNRPFVVRGIVRQSGRVSDYMNPRR